MFAEYGDTAYDITKILHILCAIIGLGAVFLNGVYGRQIATRPGKEGLAIFQANFLVSKIAEYFIYAIFVFGVLMVVLSDDVLSFGDTFIWLSMLLFLVALGISHGLLTPRVKKMEVLMVEMIEGPPPAGGPPPQAAQMEVLGKQVGVYGLTLNLLVVVILTLMVTKPGLG